MNKPNLNNLIKNVKSTLSAHSPEILTGIGIAGMIATTVLAVKATPKALDLIEDAKDEKQYPSRDNGKRDRISLTPVETIKVAWKPYVPAAITGVTSVACLIGATSVNLRRNAALATAYNIAQTSLREYKEKVTETIGEKKEQAIREKIAQDHVDKAINKQPASEMVVVGSGDVWFLEPVCGKPFKSDIETVRGIINDFNYRMTTGQEEYISLSEFYDEFGLKHTSASDMLGWNLGRDGQIRVDFAAAKLEDGRPCLELQYMVSPRYDYAKLS